MRGKEEPIDSDKLLRMLGVEGPEGDIWATMVLDELADSNLLVPAPRGRLLPLAEFVAVSPFYRTDSNISG
jgi:hypothetical protein